jgi:hypothetical protein
MNKKGNKPCHTNGFKNLSEQKTYYDETKNKNIMILDVFTKQVFLDLLIFFHSLI